MVTSTTLIPEHGAARAKLHHLLICYRLLDRICLYKDISHTSNVVSRENTLIISRLPVCANLSPSIKEKVNIAKDHHYRYIEDIKSLLQTFRTIATPTSRTSRNKSAVAGIPTIYGPRLPQGSGILQQLKDLVALGQNNRLRKIERNFLLMAMSLNWLSYSVGQNRQSAGTSNTHQSSDSSDEEQTREIIALARYDPFNILTPHYNRFL